MWCGRAWSAISLFLSYDGEGEGDIDSFAEPFGALKIDHVLTRHWIWEGVWVGELEHLHLNPGGIEWVGAEEQDPHHFTSKS